MGDYMLQSSGNYFDVELLDLEWTGFGTPIRVPSYRRPLSAMLNPLIEAGFALERVLEPIPTERFKETAPAHYEELSRQPGFLCIRAAKTLRRAGINACAAVSDGS